MSEERDPRLDAAMKEINRLRGEAGKLLERGIAGVQDGIQSIQTISGTGQVLLDVYQISDDIIIRTSPIDGIVPESIEVSMEGNILTISGSTQADDVPPNIGYLTQERRFGIFSRSVEIQIPVKSEEARARLKHSALTVTIPIDTVAYAEVSITEAE
ncbi:MAG: Hsp20/alpha crystallin family protein [Aggregatilineales bacterium]